jgi:hypothetical protein
MLSEERQGTEGKKEGKGERGREKRERVETKEKAKNQNHQALLFFLSSNPCGSFGLVYVYTIRYLSHVLEFKYV